MPTVQARARRRLVAAALTAAIVAGMLLLLIAINVIALTIDYRGQGAEWVVVAATVIADILLIAIIYRLVLEALIAIADRDRDGIPVPSLLAGLLVIYTLVLWTILAPTLNRIGAALDLELLTSGWNEPESQLSRTAVVFAFVVVSHYWIVLRYQRGGLAAAIRRWFVEWRDYRARARSREG